MSKLFDKTSINGMNLSNRFVRSATHEALANTDGTCTDALIKMMENLAEGNVGLIISGHTFVSPEGRAGALQAGIHSDEMIPGLKKMADAVHAKNGKIICQIAHAGAHADFKSSGLDVFGPSEIKKNEKTICREITGDDIKRLVSAFGDAALRAKKAGFDGVQIHSAHGYMLSQFLSPRSNKRTDSYGGCIENRARFLVEVLENIRSKTGRDFPVIAKINSEDFTENGLNLDDMLAVSGMLEAGGADAIEMSGGILGSEEKSPVRKGLLKTEEDEVYYRDSAVKFKKQLGIPLMLVGGIRSFSVAEKILDSGIADYIALSRPLIREPNLVSRWQAGNTEKATCLSCNKCFLPMMRGDGVSCEVDNRQRAKANSISKK